MEVVIMHPSNREQLAALKAVAKALKVDFETAESPYKAEFVKKIQQGRADVKAGKGVRITIEDLWNNLCAASGRRLKILEENRQQADSKAD